jgi:hypothetical protein
MNGTDRQVESADAAAEIHKLARRVDALDAMVRQAAVADTEYGQQREVFAQRYVVAAGKRKAPGLPFAFDRLARRIFEAALYRLVSDETLQKRPRAFCIVTENEAERELEMLQRRIDDTIARYG